MRRMPIAQLRAKRVPGRLRTVVENHQRSMRRWNLDCEPLAVVTFPESSLSEGVVLRLRSTTRWRRPQFRK